MNQAVEVPLLDGYLKVECFFIGGRYCQSKWFYPIDPVEVMPSHWKKSSKNSLQDRYANAQQKFDLCKLLSRRGICQETLDEQHPGDLCHHFVCPGTSERQLQWRTSWPPHFWKIPWFGCFKAKFYDNFINHEINYGSVRLSCLFTCSSLQHMVVDHQGPWAQCQNELNSETSHVFSLATSLNGLI